MNEGGHREDEHATDRCVQTEEMEHQESRHRDVGVVHNADVQTNYLNPSADQHEGR